MAIGIDDMHSVHVIAHCEKPLAIIGVDGSVRIDWDEVEFRAIDRSEDNSHRHWAILLMAVKNGTWKPIDG